MTTLTQERCVACRRDSPRVTDAEIAEMSRGRTCAIDAPQ